jgi:hypothetical protein
MKFLLLYLFTILYLSKSVGSEFVSPRKELQDYLNKNNCNNGLMNRFLLNTMKSNYGYNSNSDLVKSYTLINDKYSYNSIREISKLHAPFMNQQYLLKCYDVLVQRNFNIELKKLNLLS